MITAKTEKIILIFCEYKNHSKGNTATIICRARPMYWHTNIYLPIWQVANVSYRQYLLKKVLHCGAFGNPSCYFVSDPDWLTQMHCPVTSAQSLHAYRPLGNIPDKTLHDVTFAHRFWHGKQMTACDQPGYVLLCLFLVGCFTKISLG